MDRGGTPRGLGLSLSLLAAVEIAAGFASQTYTLASVGPNRASDAYFAALTLPQFFLTVAASPLVSVLVPILAAGDPERHRRSTAEMLSLAMGASLILVVISSLTARFWIPRLLPGFSPVDQPLLDYLARVQVLTLVPAAGCMILKAACYARRRFITGELVSAAGSLLGLAVLIWALPRFGVRAAVWVNLGRLCLCLIGLMAVESVTRLADPFGAFTRLALRRARPLVAGALYYKSEPLLDQYLSSMAAPGDLSALAFGRMLLLSGIQVVSQALVAPVVPGFAVLARNHEFRLLRSRARVRVALIGAVSVAGVVAFALVGERLLGATLRWHSATGDASAHRLWQLLIVLAGIPVAGGIGQVMTSTAYAMGETRMVTQVGATGFTIGIVLKVAGFHFLGLWGIAAATSLYYCLDAALLGARLEWHFGRLLGNGPAPPTVEWS